MGLVLRAGMSYCDVAGRLLFLDIEADRYFCLGREAEQAFRAIMASPAPVAPDCRFSDPLSRLVQAGMLIPTSDDHCPQPWRGPELALKSLLDRPHVMATGRLRMAALSDLAKAHLALRHRSLNDILNGLARRKSASRVRPDPDHQIACEVAAAFDWSARLVQSHDRCLPRAIAVTRRLMTMGIAADLVIGVSLNPFAAHSWVQCGDALVNDRLDGVRQFTPILSL